MNQPIRCPAPIPGRTGESALAPALAERGQVPPETDSQLGLLARRAAGGDTLALDTLYTAFLPRLRLWIGRSQRQLSWRGADPALEPDDIAQEAFLVFADLIRSWHGRGSLSAYVLAYFHWRLKNAIRDLSDRRVRIDLAAAPIRLLHDGSHEARDALILLDELAARLDERQRAILLLRVRDDLPWSEVARRVGLTRRTVLRDWRVIRRLVLSELLIDL